MKHLTLENFGLAIVFSLPLYLVRVDLLSLPSNVLEIFMGLFVVLSLSVAKTRKEFWKTGHENWKYILAVIFSALGFFVSSLFSDNVRPGLGILKSWILIPFTFSLFLAAVFSRGEIARIWKAYFLSCVIVAAIALSYLMFGFLTYDGRLSAFFNSPNYLAMHLVPGVILSALFLGQGSLKSKEKLLISSGLAVVISALYFTFSYAAWVSAFLAIAVVLMRRDEKKRLVVLLAVVIFVAFSFQMPKSKFNDLINVKERSSLSSRMMIWKSAVRIGKDNWLVGIGGGNFQKKYLDYQKFYPPYLEWAVPHPHNVYLAFWLYGGIIGIAGFLVLALLFFRDTSNYLKENHGRDISYLISFGAIIYMLIHGFFDTTILKNDLAVVFWLCFLPIWKR